MGPEADVWAFGVSLFSAVCGRKPFDRAPPGLYSDIVTAAFKIPETCSEEFKHLIKSIFKVSLSERPTIGNLLKHEWFTSARAIRKELPSLSDPKIIETLLILGFSEQDVSLLHDAEPSAVFAAAFLLAHKPKEELKRNSNLWDLTPRLLPFEQGVDNLVHRHYTTDHTDRRIRAKLLKP
jgi:serine/threonine protein kinase